MEQFLTWGAPYWLGRALFNDLASIRLLATGVFIGGLVCAPLCLWEIKMSPHLHQTVYGYNPTKFGRAVRLGGYRPMLFFRHGIAVGVWMCGTALGGDLAVAEPGAQIPVGVPTGWLAVPLLITAILTRSANSLVLLMGTAGMLLTAKATRLKVLILLIFLAPAIYCVLRAPQLWHPQKVIDLIARIDETRAVSLQSRIDQEDALMGKAWQRPGIRLGFLPSQPRRRRAHRPRRGD